MNVSLILRLVDRLTGPSRRVENSLKRIRRSMHRLREFGRGLRDFGLSGGIFGGLLGRNIGSTLFEFEDKMNEVRANMGRLTNEELTALRQEVRRIGSVSKYTATEVAGALLELARMGIKADAALAMLHPVTRLAGAAGTNAQQAVDYATNIATAFGVNVRSAKEMTDTVDMLAMAISNTNLTLSELYEGLKYAAPSAAASGISMKSTIATMMALAQQGQKASMGGTTLARIVEGVYKTSGPAKKALDAVGLSMRDFILTVKEAEALGTPELAGSVKAPIEIFNALGAAADKFGREPVLRAIQAAFGARGGRGAKAMLEQTEAIRMFAEVLEQRGGRAAQMEATRMEGLPGAVRKLQATWQDLVLTMGKSGLTQDLTELADAIRLLIKRFQSLDPVTQKWIARLGLLSVVMSGLAIPLGIFLIGIGAIGSGLAALAPIVTGALGAIIGGLAFLSRSLVALGAAALTNPLGWVILGVLALAAVAWLIYDNWSGIKAFFSDIWNAIADNVAGLAQWIGRQLTAIIDAIKAVGNRIYEAFASIDLSGAAQAMMQSLIDGIASWGQAAIDKARQIGASISSAINGAADFVQNNRLTRSLGIAPESAEPRASGGPVAAGRLYMVGERGPELFVPRWAGRIVPNHMLRAASLAGMVGTAAVLGPPAPALASSSSGGSQIAAPQLTVYLTINVQGAADGDEIARKVTTALNEAARSALYDGAYD